MLLPDLNGVGLSPATHTEERDSTHARRGHTAVCWPRRRPPRSPVEPYSTVLWLENSFLTLLAVERVKCSNMNGSKWNLQNVELGLLERNPINFLPLYSPITMFEPELYNQSNVYFCQRQFWISHSLVNSNQLNKFTNTKNSM